MLRRTWALLGGVLLAGTLALSGFARMDDKPGDKPADKRGDKPTTKGLAGTWKVMLPTKGGGYCLLKIESKEGWGWSGKVVASGEEIPPASDVTSLNFKDNVLQVSIRAGGRLTLEVRVPSPDADKLLGSTTLLGKTYPV